MSVSSRYLSEARSGFFRHNRDVARFKTVTTDPDYEPVDELDLCDGAERPPNEKRYLLSEFREAVRDQASWLAQIRRASLRGVGLTRDDGPWLVQLTALRWLDVAHNPQLNEAIVWSELGLEWLDASHSQLDVHATSALLGSLATAELRHLDLSHNPLGDDGVDLLGSVAWPALERLVLTDVGLGDRGLARLVESADFPRLRALELGENRLSSATTLARAHARFPALRTLNLVFNQLDDTAANELLQSPLTAQFTCLVLRQNPITSPTREALLERARIAPSALKWEPPLVPTTHARPVLRDNISSQVVNDYIAAHGATRQTYDALRSVFAAAYRRKNRLDDDLATHWPFLRAAARTRRLYAPPDSLFSELRSAFENELHPMDVYAFACHQANTPAPDLDRILERALFGDEPVAMLRAALIASLLAAPPLVPLLERGLSHPSSLVRALCARGLGNIEQP